MFLPVQLIAFLISLVLTQVSTVPVGDPLQFAETEFGDVREGYVTLQWNRMPDAAEYRLTADDEQLVYRGALPEAFVSGLADGSYQYHVAALDGNGNLLASSEVPATVVVKHWSLRLAGTLFACGLAVFLAIVALIVIGTLQTRSSSPSSVPSLSAEAMGEPE